MNISKLLRNLAVSMLIMFCASICISFYCESVYADAGRLKSSTKSSKTYKSGSSKSYSGSSSRSSGGSIFELLWILDILIRNPLLIIIIVVVIVLLKMFGGKLQGRKYQSMDFTGPPDNGYSYQPENTVPVDYTAVGRIVEKDPNFSEAAFLTRVNNMYIQFQEAWTNKNWKSIRPYETDALFNMHSKQLQQLIDKHNTNVVTDIGILGTKIVSFTADAVNDTIRVQIKARIKDYIIDDNSGKVIEGDPKEEVFMTYLWTMIRKNGVLTKLDPVNASVTQCPNCGANMNINATGECEYCGSIVSKGDYDWVVSSMELVSQE